MENKFIQRIIFDLIFVGIIFLPIFTALFLWTTFFRRITSTTVPSVTLPKLNETGISEIKKKTQERSHFSQKAPFNLNQYEYGLPDPFDQ